MVWQRGLRPIRMAIGRMGPGLPARDIVTPLPRLKVSPVLREAENTMPHISLSDELPGIRGLLAFRPETSKPLADLANILLHEPSTLSRAERELIATYVSSRNECDYCQTSHGAIAACLLEGDEELVSKVKSDFERAPISDKLKALLAIAGKVQRGGKQVTSEDIERAKRCLLYTSPSPRDS